MIGTGAAIAVGVSGCSEGGDHSDEARAAAVVAEPGSWEWVRQQFDLTPEKVHMGALLISSHPRPVEEAIDRFRRGLNEDPVSYLQAELNSRQDEVRREAASYLGARSDEIALTRQYDDGHRPGL